MKEMKSWAVIVLVFAVPLFLDLSGGCNSTYGLHDVAARKGNSYPCLCFCRVGRMINVNSLVCMPDALNPNNHSGTMPTADDLEQDCEQRVQPNVELMAKQCVAKAITCTCGAVLPPDLTQLTGTAECDDPCSGEDLATDCSNFDPKAHTKTATNAPGQPPVCLVARSDPPDPVSDPLAAGIFGETSTCEVSGGVTITRDGDPQTRNTTGVVEFTGAPCPTAQCQVGVTYRLDHVDNFQFGGFGGFDQAEIQNVTASGVSVPAAATINATGVGALPTDSTLSAGKGRRSNQACVPAVGCAEVSSAESGEEGSNAAPIGLLVDWTNHACAVTGALLGSLEGADSNVEVTLAGTITNQPPTAQAGPGATVECASAAGTPITLDASGSTDPDDNIALHVWRSGTRAGTELGSDPTLHLSQVEGTQSYFLKVVDDLGQTDEASTSRTITDTTPPTITSVTAAPNVLKPPNHKMVKVTVSTVASDLCNGAVCHIAAVHSNESVNGTADGNTNTDWEITGPKTVNLRAERAAKGTGRIYTLTVACADAVNNTSTQDVQVKVPH